MLQVGDNQEPQVGTQAVAPLKRTEAFRAVYRRGKWAHGALVSVGALPNRTCQIRVGLRTKRGLKSAAKRNRLKRQIRGLIFTGKIHLINGLDIVILIRPTQARAETNHLTKELHRLCKLAGTGFQKLG